MKQGDNALTMTLPAPWARAHHLTPGFEVEVRQEGEELILSSVPAALRRKELAIREGGEGVLRDAYRQGYDEVVVEFGNPRVLSNIQHIVGQLYGFETVEITTTTCTIKSVHEEKPEELQSHVQRMNTALGVLQELVHKQRKQRRENEHITHFRDSVLKQADLIIRLIRKYRLVEELPAYEQAVKITQRAQMYYELYRKGLQNSTTWSVLQFVETLK